jgi:CSLREA domain-containing protein
MTGLRPGACCALAALLLVLLPSAAQAANFTVTRLDDPAPGACAVNDCSLREAVIAANGNNNAAEVDLISLGSGTHNLTIGVGASESPGNTDLDITQAVRITGAGASATSINASGISGSFAAIQANSGATSIEIEDLTITGGDQSAFTSLTPGVAVTFRRAAVVGNTNTSNGGGIDANTVASLTLDQTTVSGNQGSDGGGIYTANPATITNSTISGNTATGLGGGFYNESGTTNIVNSTIASNTAPADSGGGIANFSTTNVRNTIVANNSGGDCDSFDLPTSQGNNLETASICGFNQPTDRHGDPLLGPLTNNGGTTQTHALNGASPAVNAGASCPTTDQRGVPRPQGAACDIGAYELVTSRTLPSLPDCSPTGAITLTMNAAGQTPTAFHYKVDDGPTQDVATNDSTETINLPEGSFKLEYWSETAEGGEDPQSDHQIGTALIDKTAPTLSVASDQNQSIYVITRNASVTVQAGDALSGLTTNPSAQGETVATDSRGQKAVQWIAEDKCENQTTRQFDYTVLGPGLGERAVIEPLGDGVEIDVPADGARASQKGTDFQPVTQPREIPIGTRIDTREAEARITSSKSTTETDIQDGAFSAGIFQVLQSRNADSKGRTTLELKGSNFRNCEASGKGSANAARLSRQARRRLRGDATGRFRTRGRHSAATVRGTEWTVIDRCDGTLTKVARGRVAVRDFRLAKTIVLTRGEKYLAQAEPDPPVLGKTVNVERIKGKVFVKLPRGGKFARASQKGATFVPLTEARSIPVKSIVDTRKGTVALRTARNRKGKVQSGRFSAGVFQVLQSRKRREKGLTDVVLKGGAAKFNRCGRGKAGSAQAHTSLSRRAIRRLRARARGRYRTRGRHSAATVRGTVWNMTDSCAGTLTTVKRGKVAVRDFRKRKTVVLTRGKSYLARPR